ncbi:hypothetical protein [Microbacterium paraoxydans]|uniref:Uncharacterized protein n=1 Tax=Microbacterium paraoxydans TaxID=199592 RepID=A0A1H1LBI4_9MICO|nr:hypothetical protein [Microbacterium paraoxydans]SDR71405.1 hypothetical protein SAMN04489809_0045 [Microbacterium paraoxydans]SDT08739.1 hypothetical protein SAMN04489809_3480 [Microbacterium paraoxydans]
MSERIDHVESAINNGQAAEQTDDLQEAGVHAQHAIAHGLLALVEVQQKANEIAERAVEQRRIANLIALSVPQTLMDGAEASVPSWDAQYQLRAEIREGLGL